MRKNVAGQTIGAGMVSATDGSAFTGSVTVHVTIDAGTQAQGTVGSGACTHEGNGYHTYAPSQAETNGNLLAFTFVGTGAVPVTVQVFTVSYDLHDTVRLGLTALPNAVPGAAGGVFIAGTNAPVVISGSGDALTLQSTGANGSGLNTTGSGNGDGLRAIGGATGNGIMGSGGSSSGTGIKGVGTNDSAGMEGEAGPNADGWGGITGYNPAAGGGIGILGTADDGYGISGVSESGGDDIRGLFEVSTLVAIADALLDRDMSVGTDSGSPTVRTVRQALRLLRNKWDVAAGTLTVKKEDDTTTSWTSAVTSDAAAEHITGHDPASS